RSCKESRQIAPIANVACKLNVQTVRNRHSAFAECQNNDAIEIWQMRQLLEQPRHIFVLIGQRRTACNDDKCVPGQVEMFSANYLVVQLKHRRLDSRRNHSHSPRDLYNWTSPGQFRQPETISNKPDATVPICL